MDAKTNGINTAAFKALHNKYGIPMDDLVALTNRASREVCHPPSRARSVKNTQCVQPYTHATNMEWAQERVA